jgi:zinc transport system substrate-binding protein
VRTIIILITTAALAASCGGAGSVTSGDTTVVASFYPLAYAAEKIGDTTVRVTNLTPPGAEPHDVELSVRDVERVRSADVVLYLGEGFQPNLEAAVEGAEGDAIDLLPDVAIREGPPDTSETADPHVWLDPLRYATLARRIGEALDRPAAAGEFARRLRELDEEYERDLADCERREIVTSHAAFGYLAERYGLDQIAISGLSPEAEPAPGELEQLVAEVREHGATTVFFEPLVSARLAKTIAREAGAQAAALNPVEGLTESEIERGADYFTVMRANLETLREALGCR